MCSRDQCTDWEERNGKSVTCSNGRPTALRLRMCRHRRPLLRHRRPRTACSPIRPPATPPRAWAPSESTQDSGLIRTIVTNDKHAWSIDTMGKTAAPTAIAYRSARVNPRTVVRGESTSKSKSKLGRTYTLKFWQNQWQYKITNSTSCFGNIII